MRGCEVSSVKEGNIKEVDWIGLDWIGLRLGRTRLGNVQGTVASTRANPIQSNPVGPSEQSR